MNTWIYGYLTMTAQCLSANRTSTVCDIAGPKRSAMDTYIRVAIAREYSRCPIPNI